MSSTKEGTSDLSTPQKSVAAASGGGGSAYQSPAISQLGHASGFGLGKASRSEVTERKSVLSGIVYQLVNFDKMDSDDDIRLEVIPEQRKRSISNLTNEELEVISERSTDHAFTLDQSLIVNKGGAEGIFLFFHGNSYFFFHTTDTHELSQELSTIFALRFVEPQPRSGKGRASDSEGIREADSDEAKFAKATSDIGDPNEIGTDSDAVLTGHLSEFKTSVSSNIITNTIEHKGPWAKGLRTPSQIGTMGGQNAKNYIISQLIKGTHQDGEELRTEQQKKTAAGEPELHSLSDGSKVNIGGRFEWLHIIGSSLGGPNILGNLVAGTYDANTEMIPLEHRVALWGQTGYEGKSRPTPDNPIKIEGVAEVVPATFIGKSITLTVFHGADQLLERSYKTLNPEKLTKDIYVDKQIEIEKEIAGTRDGDDVNPVEMTDDQDSQLE